VPLFRILFLIFFTVPLIEIYFLLQVSGLLGIIPTIFFCVLTAVTGAILLRHQGISTLMTVQAKLSTGELPAREMVGGVILLCSGALLLTPGFVTDAIGFLCLVPRIRNALATRLIRYLVNSGKAETVQTSVILNGEYWEDENDRITNKD
jgi:UPF0716 protein FxsA